MHELLQDVSPVILFALSPKNRTSLETLLEAGGGGDIHFADDQEELRSVLLRRAQKN